MIRGLSGMIGLVIGLLFGVVILPVNKQKATKLIKTATPEIVRTAMPVIEMVDEHSQFFGKYKIAFEDVVLSQLILETGYGTSNVFKEGKNGFGMKPSSRNRKSIRGHAAYETFEESVKDFKKWQEKFLGNYEAKYGKITSDEEYIKFLGNLVIPGSKPDEKFRYAEDPKYEQKVTNILQYVRLVKKLQQEKKLEQR